MKCIYHIIIFSFIAFASCKSNSKEIANRQTNTDSTKKEVYKEETVELTDDQIKAIDLQTGSIEQRNLKTTLKANGKLMLPPQNQAKVSLLVGGLVKTINVTEGVFVSQGQTLATIENNDIIQLQQDYLENKSQLKYLQAEFARQEELQKDNINATKTFQQADNDLTTAQAKQKGLKAKLQLQGINADNVSTTNFTNRVTVAAPISGYIHHINLSIGKFTDANAVLFDIVDNRFLHIDLTIFEKDIHKIATGQRLVFSDANNKAHTHPATIFALNKAFEENQQAIIAHAKIDEKTETLLPGMYVEARIQIDKNKTNCLPIEAVVNNGDEHFIYIQTAKNHFAQIAVNTGATDLGFTEIMPLQELPPNAKVVIKGAYYLLSQLTKGSGGE